MRAVLAVLCGVALGLLACSGARAAVAVDEVLACMRANVPKTVQLQEIELTARDAAQRERRLRGKLYLRLENGQLRAMLRLAAPPDLAGAAYLLRERDDVDEMYMYVPALSRVRRLSGTGSDDRLWGTDIAYDDLRQLGGGLNAAQTRLLGVETLAGRAVHRLKVQPADGALNATRLELWVDTASCIALRIDFYGGDRPRRRLSVDPARLQRTANYWYADQIVLADLEAGTQTRLSVLGVKLDDSISDRLFLPASFYLGH